MTEQPVQNAAIVKFVAGIIAMLAAKYLPSLGITDVQALAAAGIVFGGVSWIITRVTKSKVAPLSKMARLAPAAHSEYLAAVAQEKKA